MASRLSSTPRRPSRGLPSQGRPRIRPSRSATHLVPMGPPPARPSPFSPHLARNLTRLAADFASLAAEAPVRRLQEPHMSRSAFRVFATLVVLASSPLSGQSPQPPRAHQVICIPPTAGATCAETFDFQRNGPVAFLAFLRNSTTPFSVAGLHKGWLLPSDVPVLLAHVSSSEPCALVVMASASTVPLERSTVGQEALFLLDGVRGGTYPPTLHSHAYDSRRRDAILQWARQQPR